MQNEKELTQEQLIENIAHDLQENKIIMLKINEPELLRAKLYSDHNLKVYFRPATLDFLEEGTREPLEGIYNFIVEGYDFPDEIPVTWDEPGDNSSEEQNNATATTLISDK